LKYFWDYNTLVNGSVSSWVDNISSYSLAMATSSAQPTKSSTGITFDGGDYLTQTNPIVSDTAMTVSILLKIMDTSATQQVFILDSIGTNIGLIMQGTTYSPFKKWQVVVKGTGGTIYPAYLTNSQNCYQRMCMFTIAYKYPTTVSFYINDTLQSPLAGIWYFCTGMAEATLGTYCSGHGSFNLANTSMILAWKVNFAYLTQAEILTDYNSFKNAGYLP
jgi:hypothetical protein